MCRLCRFRATIVYALSTRLTFRAVFDGLFSKVFAAIVGAEFGAVFRVVHEEPSAVHFKNASAFVFFRTRIDVRGGEFGNRSAAFVHGHAS